MGFGVGRDPGPTPVWGISGMGPAGRKVVQNWFDSHGRERDQGVSKAPDEARVRGWVPDIAEPIQPV